MGIRHVIVISGTPGVGKTLISKALSSKIGAQVISLSDLVKREKLYKGVNRMRDTLIVDLERTAKRVREVISSTEGDVIVEGHFAAEVVPPESVSMAFVLRRDPEELRLILKGRNYSEGKVMENVASEILDVCLYDAVRRFGVDRVHEINVSSRGVEEVVEEMVDVLEGKRERRVGVVDWLGKLEEEGKLEEYLGKI